MKFKILFLKNFQCYSTIICVSLKTLMASENIRHFFDFTEDSIKGKTCISENLITMVWMDAEDHSTASGLYILVAVTQICSVRPQSVFQLSAAFPNLVLLPCGRKMSRWLSSQLIGANREACAFSMSHLGTFHTSGERQTFISCLIISCCHFKHAKLRASTSMSKTSSPETNNTRGFIKPAESLPKHARSLTSLFRKKMIGTPVGCKCLNLSSPNTPLQDQPNFSYKLVRGWARILFLHIHNLYILLLKTLDIATFAGPCSIKN